VTGLRVMPEHAQGENRDLERPLGHFQPNMVWLWDDLMGPCERHGLRLLLTPFDTFWMWRRWDRHPYNSANAGSCARRSDWLTTPAMLEFTPARPAFAVERWGGSGAVFDWDLCNEMHPAHTGDGPSAFFAVTGKLSRHVRDLETRLDGRSHPQTVSRFGPVLDSEHGPIPLPKDRRRTLAEEFDNEQRHYIQ